MQFFVPTIIIILFKISNFIILIGFGYNNGIRATLIGPLRFDSIEYEKGFYIEPFIIKILKNLENDIDFALKTNTKNFKISIDEVDDIINQNNIKIFDSEPKNTTIEIVKSFFKLCERKNQDINYEELQIKLRFFFLFKIYEIILEHVKEKLKNDRCICDNKIFEKITEELLKKKLFIVAESHLKINKYKTNIVFGNKGAVNLVIKNQKIVMKCFKLNFILFLRNLLYNYLLSSIKASNSNDQFSTTRIEIFKFCVFHQMKISGGLQITKYLLNYNNKDIKHEERLNFYNFEMSIMALEKTIFKALNNESLNQNNNENSYFENKYNHQLYFETDNFCEILFTIDSFFTNTKIFNKKLFFDYTNEILHLFQRYIVRYKDFDKIVGNLKSNINYHFENLRNNDFKYYNFVINLIPIYDFNIKNLESNFAKLSERNNILYNENTKNEIFYFVYSINYVFTWMFIDIIKRHFNDSFIKKIKFNDTVQTQHELEKNIETKLLVFFCDYEDEEKAYYMIQLAFYNLLSFNFKSLLKKSGDRKLNDEKQKNDFFYSCTTKNIRLEEIIKIKKKIL
ncbi:hypothetical protein GVAV_003005 [Gurleya vavrai]